MMTLLVKMCYFASVLRLTKRYLHYSLPTIIIQYEMEEKSICRQKSGRASNHKMLAGSRSVRPVGCAANAAGLQYLIFL